MRKMKHYLLLLTALLVSGGVWGGNVCKIGTTEYLTLQDALNVGGQIQLIDNVVFEENNTNPVFTVSKNSAIDLAGYSISFNSYSAGASINTHLFRISASILLTVTGHGTIENTYSGTYTHSVSMFRVNSGSTLTISPSGGEIKFVMSASKSKHVFFSMHSAGTLVDNGGLFSKNPNVSGSTYEEVDGWYKKKVTASNECKIGTKEYATIAEAMDTAAAATPQYPTITLLKDATYSGAISSPYVFDGSSYTLTVTGAISDGTYSCKVSTTQAISDGRFNAAVTASNSTISGGSFNRAANMNQLNGKFVSGYDYASDNTTYLVTSSANLSNNKLISGTYETAKIVGSIDGYLAVGYTTESAAQAGCVTVVPISASNAKVMLTTINAEMSYYTDMATAVTAWKAADGSTLALLQDISTSNYYQLNTAVNVTLDLNGRTWTSSSSYGTLLVGYATGMATNLTIKSSKTGGTMTNSGTGSVLYCLKDATLNISSGTFSQSSTGAVINFATGATVNIQDGTFSRGDNNRPIINSAGNGTVNIYGGMFTGGASSVEYNSASNLRVYGGSLGEVSGVGNITIYGGSVAKLSNSTGTTTTYNISGGYVGAFEAGYDGHIKNFTGGEYGFNPTSYLNQNVYQANKISEDPARWQVVAKVDDDPGSDSPTNAVAYIQNSEHYKDTKTYFLTLQGALRHSQNNDEIFLMNDITLSSPIQIDGDKKVYLHLERHNITNNVADAYMCNVHNGAQLIIVGTPDGQAPNAQLIIPEGNTTSKGFFRVWNSTSSYNKETLDVYNVTMSGATNNGYYIRCFSQGANVKLQDVDANMTLGVNRNVLIGKYCNFSIIRGTYTYKSSYANEAVFVNEDYSDGTIAQKANSKVLMENVIVHSDKHVVIETMGDNNTFINCTFDVSNGSDEFYTAGFSLSNAGKATISSGTFIGGTGAYIYTSGGTLNITGGYIEGRNDDSSVGVAVHAHQDRNLPTDGKAIMNISGGSFKGAVKVTSGLCDSAKMYISGGTFRDVSYVVSGPKSHLLITGGKFTADPTTYVKADYTVSSETISDTTWYTVSNGQQPVEKDTIVWSAPTDWSTGEVPTSTTVVTIPTGKMVTISSGTTAQALKIAQTGEATIVVKDGAKLIVGKEGVTQDQTGGTPEIIVEDGGYFYIEPAKADEHPYGTIKYESGAKLDSGKESGHIWQHIGIPTMAAPTIGLEAGYKTGADMIYLNKWDIMTGWKPIGLDSLNTPFKGYNFSNDAEQLGSVYTFSGNLVGSKVNTMVFNREGYTFFGNSYSAPVNIYTMLQGFDDKVQRAVYIYNSQQEIYATITVDNAGKYAGFGKSYPSEIKPMQGFFIYCPDKASENVNYQDAVWNFALTVSHSPKRGEQMTIDGMAIQLSSDNGRSDITTLMEGAEYTSAKDDAEALKMANPSTSIELYTVSENGKMAIYAAESLDQTALGIRTNAAINYTIAFDNVTVENYELVDQITGARTAIVDGASYTFNASANTTIDNRLSIRKITGEATGVGEIENAGTNDNVYTVLGQFVGKTANWNMLPAGVYVVNGVKLVK